MVIIKPINHIVVVELSIGVTRIYRLVVVSNMVEDGTPQLGGDLDLNSNDINGT